MATKIIYNGAVISTINPGYSATLECAGHEMDGNVIVEVAPEQGGGSTKPACDPYITFSSPNEFTIQAILSEEDMLGGGGGLGDGFDFGWTTTPAKSWDGTIEYSTNTKDWAEWDGVTEISSIDGKLYLRGTGNTIITGESLGGVGFSYYSFAINGEEVSCSGNLETLLDYPTVSNGQHPEIGDACFYYLFSCCDALVAAPDLLAENLGNGYYTCSYMYENCTNLVKPPKLYPTVLGNPEDEDYYQQAYTYSGMFSGCTSLTTAPKLPATTLSGGCYSSMFYNCSSLTTAPALPATTLAPNCYNGMFSNCESLTTVPALPATTLANGCYAHMFSSCPNVNTLPELPAISLVNSCYSYMFSWSEQIKISTTQSDEYPYEYRIPSSGVGIDNSEESDYDSNAPTYEMIYETAGTFTDDLNLNTTYYTSNEIIPAVVIEDNYEDEEVSGGGVASSITTANITLVLEPSTFGLEFSSAIYTKCENGIISVGRIDIPYEEASITETTTYELKNVVSGSFIYLYAFAPNSLDWTIEPLYAIDHLMDEAFWQVNGTGDITFTIKPWNEFGGGVEP